MNQPSKNCLEVSTAALIGLIVVLFLLQQGMIGLRDYIAPEGNLFKWMVIANQVVSIFLPVVMFIALFRLPWKDALGLYKPPLVKTFLAVAAGFVLIYGINSVLPRLIPPTPVYTKPSASIIAYNNVWELLLVVLTISIAAPLADEFFFRGLLLRGFMAKYGTVAAILIVGCLTALFHTFEPFKLVHSFLMSVLFASAVVWSGSLWTSIILHALHNSLSLLSS
jgi:membrane protease YdiL (CAAX protease family)